MFGSCVPVGSRTVQGPRLLLPLERTQGQSAEIPGVDSDGGYRPRGPRVRGGPSQCPVVTGGADSSRAAAGARPYNPIRRTAARATPLRLLILQIGAAVAAGPGGAGPGGAGRGGRRARAAGRSLRRFQLRLAIFRRADVAVHVVLADLVDHHLERLVAVGRVEQDRLV